MGYVEIKGRIISIKDGNLSIYDLMDSKFSEIKDFSEIKGFEKLTALKTIFIRGTQISEIKGLAHLKDLESLDLKENKITKIKAQIKS